MDNLERLRLVGPELVGLRSDGAIQASSPTTVLMHCGADGWAPMPPMSTAELVHFDGFAFALFAIEVPQPTTPPPWPGWRLTLGTRDVTLQIQWLGAWSPDGHARAELHWDDDVRHLS